jgi:hypothetical protein
MMILSLKAIFNRSILSSAENYISIRFSVEFASAVHRSFSYMAIFWICWNCRASFGDIPPWLFNIGLIVFRANSGPPLSFLTYPL